MIFRATDPALIRVLAPFKRAHSTDFTEFLAYLNTCYHNAATLAVVAPDASACRRAYLAGEANAVRALLAAISTCMNEPS
jgi:hypothetical protein